MSQQISIRIASPGNIGLSVVLSALNLNLYTPVKYIKDNCFLVSVHELDEVATYDEIDTCILSLKHSVGFIKTSIDKHWLSEHKVWEAVLPLNVPWVVENDIRHDAIREYFRRVTATSINEMINRIYALPKIKDSEDRDVYDIDVITEMIEFDSYFPPEKVLRF